MNDLIQCKHENQEMMFCMTENCTYASPCVCHLCLHDHQTLILKKIKYFQEKIKPFFQIAQKRTSLEQKIRKKFQEKRLKALQLIQKQETSAINKLNNIADQTLVRTITDLSQFKFIESKSIKEILNDKILSKDRIDIIDELALLQDELINNFELQQNKRNVKRVLIHPSVDIVTKKIHINQQQRIHKQNTKINSNNNAALNEKQSTLFQQISDMNIEEQCQEQFETKICGSFDEGKIFLQNSANRTSNVSLCFKFTKTSQKINFRKNIVEFIQALGHLQKTSLLKIQISKQCPLALWNLKKIDEKCSILPQLQQFRLTYHYYMNSQVNLYDFPKLKQKLQGNIFIKPLVCPKTAESEI